MVPILHIKWLLWRSNELTHARQLEEHPALSKVTSSRFPEEDLNEPWSYQSSSL